MVALIAWLDREEEEGAIAAVVDLGNPYRATEQESELILLERRYGTVDGGRRELTRCECRIAVVPICRAVKAIGAGFCRGVDDTPTGLPVLRRVGRSLHRELLHRFRREADHRARQSHARIVHAVGEDGGAAHAATVDTQVKSRHG